MVDALTQSVGVSLSYSLIFGIGEFYENITDLHLSYEEALEVLRCEGMAGSGAAIRIGDLRNHGFPHKALLEIESAKNQLLQDFKSDRFREAHSSIDKSGAWEVVASVIAYLENHYAYLVDLTALARTVGLNVNYLGRVFKERTGKTFFEYLTNLRLDAACRQLSTTGKSVTTLARETGFINKRNMARAFKHHLGQTPSEYRTHIAAERLKLSR